MRLRIPALLLALAAVSAFAQFGGGGSAFTPPQAKIQYAPDRDYDLMTIDVAIDVDWPHRAFTGVATERLAPLRDGLDHITMDAGANLKIETVTVDGRSCPFTHDGKKLIIASGPIPRAKVVQVVISYDSQNAAGRGFGQGGGGGWHWIQDRVGDPNRVGFWTQGETESNSNWVPMWDYPNDFVTSQTETTVPADWNVVGNGNLISNKLNPGGKSRTFTWRLDIPHATYLLTLCGGPFDIGHDTWRGVPLWYVVPKGEGDLIKESFGHTPDMLSFYSDTLGYKYPWPKYAQDAMFDFGGGMENASATTLGEPSLTDERMGYYSMDSLNSHELGHQWFGDTVTCKDWGQIWLNESFATYMQMMYFEHSRGRYGYQREIEDAMQEYFNEAKSYKRPIVTNLYSNPDVMFDSHTYPKGGVVLHTLRKMLGDEGFFAGLHQYLEVHQHTPVESNDLCEALTSASGINCHPFFDQWLYKPGHPVIDYTWTWDDASKAVTVHVKQTQDTSNGTPIYSVKTAVGLIDGSHFEEVQVQLVQKEQDFRISRDAKPDAVLFDPDHNFLREIPNYHWEPSELPFILKTAPNCIDKNRAMRQMLAGTPTDGQVSDLVAFLKSDNSQFPAIETYPNLIALKKEALRPFFEAEMNHADFTRRVQAIEALGRLPKNDQDQGKLRALLNDQTPYGEISAAMQTLASWDINANTDAIMKASEIPSTRNIVRNRALAILADAHSDKAMTLLLADAAPGKPDDVRVSAINALAGLASSNAQAKDAIRTALKDKSGAVLFAAVQAAGRSGDNSFVPDLQALLNRTDLPDAERFKPFIQNTIKNLG